MNLICPSCHEVDDSTTTCSSCGEPLALQGQYHLLDVVGSGSFGTTYRARRINDGQIVAIKEMLVRRAQSLKSLELFEREAGVLGQLDHRGIPDFIDQFSVDAGRSTALYLVQEFIDGQTLADAQKTTSRIDDVFAVLAELCDILTYLQGFSPPVIHRDIKPENIMRRAEDGSLVLIDFGSVRVALKSDEGAGSTVAGTFGFMAPEQLMGSASPASDVYGVAATGVALLSGQDPQTLMDDQRRIDLARLHIPENYREILTQMLSPSASDRPDAARAAQRLRQVLQQGPAAPSDGVQRIGRQLFAGIPPAPRPLSKEFEHYYASRDIFAGLGIMLIVIGVGVIGFIALLFWFIASQVPEDEGELWIMVWITSPIGGLVALFGLLSLTAGLLSSRQKKRVWQEGKRVIGEITEVTVHGSSNGGAITPRYHYAYSVDGEEWHRGSFEGRPSQPADTSRIGNTVALLYLEDSPDANILVAEGKRRR